MSIKVKNLTKSYNGVKAIDNINFEVQTGQIVGFIGPNGAGKSTTIKILNGYLMPDQGNVYINGHEISQNSIEIRRQIGYLPEHNPLYIDMYVKEYLSYSAQMCGIKPSKQLTDNIIETTGLTIEQNKKIAQLSKGYRQRVGLAAALIHNPSVLILDEPTTGLDPNQIVEIRNLIAHLGKEKTVLLSTHLMQEVQAICNRIIIINKGTIIVDEMQQNIHKFVSDEKFVFVVEFEMDMQLKNIKEIKNILNIAVVDYKNFIIESTDDIRKDIFNLAVKYNNTVLSLQKKEKSLEEIFQELTKK